MSDKGNGQVNYKGKYGAVKCYAKAGCLKKKFFFNKLKFLVVYTL